MPQPNRQEIHSNIHNPVKVKLTETGIAIMREKYNKLPNTFKDNHSFNSYINRDVDGYSTFQLGALMSTFGEHLHLGSLLPFEREIIIIN